jgi:hypothetical protein
LCRRFDSVLSHHFFELYWFLFIWRGSEVAKRGGL